MKSILLNTEVLTIILLSVVGALISYISIFGVIKLLRLNSLMDNPNERKVHTAPTPSMGGIGVFLGIITAWLLGADTEMIIVLILFSLLLLIGILDDLKDLSAYLRLGIQVCIGIVLFIFDFKIDSLHGIFGITEISSVISFLITVFFTVGIINAFNLIDGINGLAGGIVAINSFVFGTIFYLNSELQYATLSFVLGSSLFGFLLHNFKKKANIFLGDSGSLVLGGAMAIFSLKVFGLESSNQILNINLVIGILLIPVLDVIRVVIVRLLNGRKPFDADNNHIHHKLLKITKSHLKASFIIHLITLISVLIVPLLLKNNEKTLLVLCVLVFGINLLIDSILFLLLKFKKKNYEQVQ
jgi:UDP-N-acetylmuramyl pentapeptide phosphotransferase/UDP-N-acetylglucosamine-1-phosphate transferase